MKLPAEGARWLVKLRWLACAHVFIAVWLAWAVLDVVENPTPLLLVGVAMVAYNLWLEWLQRQPLVLERNVQQNIFRQVVLDLVALTLLLYFSDIARNPFLFYFVFHMFIGSMYLRGRAPYACAALATGLVGGVMLAEYLRWIPSFPMRFPSDPPDGRPVSGTYELIVFTALASTVWCTVYFATSIRRYVDRAHEEIRQKEKMVGIGQLVAGIAHQIANPLDGVQNCLQTIGQHVRDDAHLTDYVQMMAEALQRIERTAKRVQAFARPRGIQLQPTDVNAAVESTLAVLGTKHAPDVAIRTELGTVPPVHGDSYTLQEVLFNLCTNALAAMPSGGTLTIRTAALGRAAEDHIGSVAIDVSDTGVGIPRVQLERIFEPFFTTRAESGGTGLGLGLCRMLINEMDGHIEVRSALGQGTTFSVILNPAGSHRSDHADQS